MRELLEMLELLEAVPQEKLKRATVRPSGEVGFFDPGASKHGMAHGDMIGWFTTAANDAIGWHIFEPSNEEKKEFGSNVQRVYAGKSDTTSIAKFNLLRGTFAFLNNRAYEDGKISFQKFSPYRKLIIENTPKALSHLG